MAFIRWNGTRRGWIAAFIFVAMLFVNSSELAAAASADTSKTTFSLAEYQAELDRIASEVSSIPKHPEGINALKQSLPAAWSVEAAGQHYEIPTAWLSEALTDVEKQQDARPYLCEEAADRLHLLRNEAEKMARPPTGVDRADGAARLKKILSGREFQQVHEQSWLSQLWAQVERWIDWILEHTLGRLMGEGILRTTVLYILIGGVFLVVAVWLVRSFRTLARMESLHVDSVFLPGKLWRDWMREAMSAAGKGDYRAAVHAAYWAGVYRLAELGAWRLDGARTPREYLQLANQPIAAAEQGRVSVTSTPQERAVALAALTRSMEASWYGYSPATQQDFDMAVNHLETLGCRSRSTAQTANS